MSKTINVLEEMTWPIRKIKVVHKREAGTSASGDYGHPGRPGERGGSQPTNRVRSVDFRNPRYREWVSGTINRELAASPFMPDSVAFATDHGEELPTGSRMAESVLAWANNPGRGLNDATVALQVPAGQNWTQAIAAMPEQYDPANTWAIYKTVPQADRMDAIVTHEMGHVLYFHLQDVAGTVWADDDHFNHSGGKMPPTGFTPELRQQWRDTWGQIVGSEPPSPERERAAGNYNAIDEHLAPLTQYASTNDAEYFAEAYTAYRYGRPVPKFMSDFFDTIKVDKLRESKRGPVHIVEHLRITAHTYMCHLLEGH